MVHVDANVADPAPTEKLGAFYLGRLYDAAAGAVRPAPLLYDSKDLTTHAVCVGMTGSGKTGLCISLLEEAALDGIPAIAIDPKGDIGNLLLAFPNLDAADFEPWVDPGEAARKSVSVREHAAATARLWREGLAEWGQDGRRIARLRAAADVAIFTPGSTAGLPISVLRSFAAPPAALSEDADAFRERVSAAASGLLALVGIEADPLRSREHILLANVLDHRWRQGRDLDVTQLIREIQAPPFSSIGVMDLETVYPSADRFELSMRLNNLVAAPGFAAWMEGTPLDVPSLLSAPDGRPRVAIMSIAHLSDAERMFFVTMLLNEIGAWIRTQSGTASLRALLYMDEVFGYLPPIANPPSKQPMLTLLKQARAFGVGVVLATQNPVDLDYKGLSNTGTWLIGRLQTERDKLRLLDGLEGAAANGGAGFQRGEMERVLSGLSSRVFLMHNVHEDAPALFHSRWAMSYLRGPLTRDQIRQLMGDRRPAPAAAADPAPAPAGAAGPATPAAGAATERPHLPPGIKEAFLAPAAPTPAGARLLYRPALLGTADLHYALAKAGVDAWRRAVCIAPLGGAAGAEVWRDAEVRFGAGPELAGEPDGNGRFAALPSAAAQERSHAAWRKALETHLYRSRPLTLRTCARLELVSRPDESPAEFRVRLREAAHERRDIEIEKLRKRYAPKLASLERRLDAAEERLAREQSQYQHRKLDTVISLGTTVLGALFGRKLAGVGTAGRAGSTLRGAGRAARERQDVARAQQAIAELQRELADLSAAFEREAEETRLAYDPETLEIAELAVRPRKSDIAAGPVTLLWTPWWVTEDGTQRPAHG